MSKLTFKNKRNFAKSAFKKVFTFFIGTALALGIFSAVDGDGYLFLLQHNTSAGSLILQVMQTVSKTLGISNSTSNESVGEQGFNTLLIQKMTAGYAKDYLSICLENENGKLDVTSRKVYAPISAIVGINASETKFYQVGDGVTLPKSDIPVNGVKKGSYGTGKYSLYTWSNQTRSNGATGIGGPFAYTPSTGSWTGIPTKSVYNKGSHTPGGKGDAYLMPDCVAGLNGFLATGMNEIDLSAKDLKSSNYSDMISAFITSYEHNVGSGLKKSLYGISMTASDSKIKHGSSKETKERLDFVCADIAESINELSDKQFSALVKQLNNTAAIPGEICLIKHGWKISAEMKSFLLDHSSNAIACWNIINPKDKINNSSQLNNKLSAATTSITALTGYSSSKCDTLYGTIGGSYAQAIKSAHPSWVSQREYGTTFKVMEGSTDALGEKGTKRIIAIPGIPMQHIFASTAFGERIANKMLIYAGVDASLVNASKVSNTNSSTATMTAGTVSFETKSDVIDDLKAHGCDTGKLNVGRYAVLVAARKMQGSEYVWGAGHDGCDSTKHSGYDCSGYVAHAIRASGIDKVASFSWVPNVSGGWGGNDNSHIARKSFSSLGYSGLLPADIIWHSGHVFIWVGSKGGHQWTLQAEGRNGNTDSAGLPMKINGWHGYDNKSSYVTVNRLKGYYAPTDHF